MKKPLFILLAQAAAVLAVGASSASASRTVQVDFVKHVTDPANFVFAGTVSGDVSGDLASHVVSIDAVGPIYTLTFEWVVTAGAKSFTARTSGIWNTRSGKVVMTGRVVAGYLNGALVVEKGQLVDPATLTFEGSLRLLPV